MWFFGDLGFPSVILVNKPPKALCLRFQIVYLLSLWTYWYLKITQGPTRFFSMEILEGVKRQTSWAAYNGPKQQWYTHFNEPREPPPPPNFVCSLSIHLSAISTTTSTGSSMSIIMLDISSEQAIT